MHFWVWVWDSLATLDPQQAILTAGPALERVACEPGLLEQLPDPAGRAAGGCGPRFTSLPTHAGLTLQLFVWPAGVWTPIHDHTSWGVYLCVDGRLVEDRFSRLDDGAQASHAHLRHVWRAVWRPGQHSTLLPYAGGIHRVGNPSDRQAVSLHLYGPRQSDVDGRDYDPRRDFVCDRLIEPVNQHVARIAA